MTELWHSFQGLRNPGLVQAVRTLQPARCPLVVKELWKTSVGVKVRRIHVPWARLRSPDASPGSNLDIYLTDNWYLAIEWSFSNYPSHYLCLDLALEAVTQRDFISFQDRKKTDYNHIDQVWLFLFSCTLKGHQKVCLSWHQTYQISFDLNTNAIFCLLSILTNRQDTLVLILLLLFTSTSARRARYENNWICICFFHRKSWVSVPQPRRQERYEVWGNPIPTVWRWEMCLHSSCFRSDIAFCLFFFKHKTDIYLIEIWGLHPYNRVPLIGCFVFYYLLFSCLWTRFFSAGLA